MSNTELATTNNNTLTDMVGVPELTNDSVADIVRQAEGMEAAHRLAKVLCNTEMVPAGFRGKPDDGAAAILYGAEIGLKPQQALQQVFVVHGKPAIYARTMVALLKAKGYRFSTVESTDEVVTVEGVSPRGEQERSSWTIERAKKAGYTTNKKYLTDPQAMLYAKAASEVCRKLAPDVLLGIAYTREELELEPVKMTAVRTDQPTASAAAAPVETQGRDWLGELAAVEDIAGLEELMGQVRDAGLPDGEYKELAAFANSRWTALSTPEDKGQADG
ncbi:hypothetical protein G7Y31_06800 [Corynebacterium lizhenjunii]|uniref:RecT-like ssDNA binding protein n=1 Tax=Corynebacterium lizhenjunii TaxID=2709394 RepID=A0A7T0KCL4_9CORY|nr:hypothetical protein [Corynebacterium lizhenjunii]QPK78293.1 hypothetical protein G7Y31_06800 [Corynebacterium lizhenjunii]